MMIEKIKMGRENYRWYMVWQQAKPPRRAKQPMLSRRTYDHGFQNQIGPADPNDWTENRALVKSKKTLKTCQNRVKLRTECKSNFGPGPIRFLKPCLRPQHLSWNHFLGKMKSWIIFMEWVKWVTNLND